MEKRGYLVKEGGSTVKNWRKRWFVLRGHAITYSKNPEDPTLLGTIYLEDVAAVEPTNERPSQKHVFRLCGHDNARTWYLSAANEADMKDWMAAIQRALGSDSKPRSSVRRAPV